MSNNLIMLVVFSIRQLQTEEGSLTLILVIVLVHTSQSNITKHLRDI